MIGLKGEKRGTKQRKLSESSHTDLRRSKSSSKSSDSSSSSGKKRVTLQNVEQDEASTDVSELKSIGKAQTLSHSSVDYTLSLNHLLDVNLRNCSQQSTPLSSKLDDSLDITIYWADERGLKFSLIGGKFATASSLLLLLADHLGIVADIFKQVCALWMVSDLLEVQLKPHHNPYEIRKNWMQFLQRFTNAESSELVADEPLLVLKRNVQLPVERERELEEDYTNEILTEILYRSAKQEVLNGRYICDIDLNIKLAALQMAIDLEANEDVDILDVFGEEIETFFPLKYRHNVKTFHLFGIPIIGCKGLETRILQEYRNIRLNFEGKHSCRKAYLNIIRNTPFYGQAAAFFRGYVERPSGRPLKEIKRMILSVTLPDIPVLIGISCGYVTLIDEAKQEVLLVQRLHDCDCRYVDDHFEVAISAAVLTECPCFLLTFPDTSFLTDHNLNSESEMLKFSEKIKVLQVFSKQAIMIEALMNSLSKLLERNTEQNTDSVIPNLKYDNCRQDLGGAVSDNSSPDDKNAYVTNVPVNGHDIQQNHSNSLEIIGSQCSSSPTSSRLDEQTRGSSSSTSRSLTNVYNSPSPLISNIHKLCLATLDADGHCVDAQGSLRVLLEVM
uniref:FERM domain-containing protein 8 n=1 Tax=Wuchereria bancrofti TaxID=6293 RepID=A0A1I8EUW7_WUCBA